MSFLADTSKFQVAYHKYAERIRISKALNPEWWVFLLSGTVWVLLCIQSISNSIYSENSSTAFQLCYSINSVIEVTDITSTGTFTNKLEILYVTIKGNIISWIIMIVAMMFPLLEKSIRHVGISVRRTQRDIGIFFFLIGYLFLWTLIGFVFLLLPLFLEWFLPNKTFLSLLIGILFIIAAVLSWKPSRRVIMMKCEFTMPIRIYGWLFYRDTLVYGFRIGWACLGMCWLVMTALMLARHHFALMFVVSSIVLIERYFVAHENKLPGYAWMCLGVLLIGVELTSLLF
ncbi:DUF2182 domain-containing protein [Pseudotenacibaculum sp. MALMAid0570]|uniref:copper chaperone n=1 Tax=Pseudotenacibaculum sp. MALMAid0570 TaxID=3143938 RepID=UPI0032DFB51F